MREILFRGKDKDGNWVKGDLIHGVGYKKGNMYILPIVENLAYIPNCHPIDGVKVIPETVGQFTGLTDKNGVKIFEGDILYVPNYEHTEHKVRCLVEWDELNLSFTTFSPRSSFFVLGNKFDNPDLLNE